MEYRRASDGKLNIRLDPGDELVASLKKICESEGIRNAVFSGIGACKKADIGHYDTEKKSYHNKSLDGMMEIVSLSGNVTVSDGMPLIHAHIAIGLPDFSVKGGHVNMVEIDPTCEITLMPVEGTIERAFDQRTGLKLQRF